MKYGYGLYHNAQEKELLQQEANNNRKLKVLDFAKFVCKLGIGLVCLALICFAYLGV